MSFACNLCDKRPAAGKSVSHSHRAVNRRFLPNLRRMRIIERGVVRRVYVCTNCLRSGRVHKVP